MNKGVLTALFLMAVLWAGAQPLPYYQDAYNESDQDLREALHDIIRVHSKLPYSSSSTDTWDVLKASDVDTANASNVLLIYAGVSVNGPQEYNNGNGWTREHVWPKSLGNFNTNAGVGTDCHNLKPADDALNSLRSNLEYDDLGTGGSAVNYNGSPTGNRYNGSAGVFEPRDAVKGDVARIILYMDLRYEGDPGEPDLVVREQLNSGGTTFAVLSTLLAWHWADPVDSFEMHRNDVIHQMQGNRNPFIDHPELVHYLYGDSIAVAWNPFMAVSEVSDEAFKLGANPSNSFLQIEAPTLGHYQLWTTGMHLVQEGVLLKGKNAISTATAPSGQYFLLFGDPKNFQRENIIIAH
jgi:endonuclease I